jgi:oligopeptide transport system substrate-binding protein
MGKWCIAVLLLSGLSVGCDREPLPVQKLVEPLDLGEVFGEASIPPGPSSNDSKTNQAASLGGTDGHLYHGTNVAALPGGAHNRAPADGLFRWIEGGAEYLDPNKCAEGACDNIVINMFEPLLNYSHGNGPPTPGVAKRYDVSADGKVYTFYLRDNARWSDGEKVTAHDFVYSWKRVLTPETASKTAFLLWKLKNGRAFNEGELRDFSKVGVRAIDDWTLEVILEHPYPYFPHLAAYVAYSPAPRKAIEAHGDQWTRPGNIVVNGPFTLTKWKIRDRVELEKNPLYWDADAVRLKGAVILSNDSEMAGWQRYESGKAHWTPGQVPTDKIAILMREGRPDFYIDPYMCIYYYTFRVDKPPFDDVRIRRAFNAAFDKERVVKHIARGGQQPASHLIPEMFEPIQGYISPQGDPFDTEVAMEALASAGYPRGAGLPPVEVVYNTYEAHKAVAESFQRNVKDTLGMEVTINNMEWKTLLQRMREGDFQIGRGGWCADYPDPMSFLEVFHSGNENNYGGYNNPEYDALLSTIDETADATERNRLMAKAEGILNRDVPIIPVYFYTRGYALKPFVKGFKPHFRDKHPLKYLSLED